MARDYKNRARPKPRNQSAPSWAWFAVGMLVGAALTGLVWLKLGTPPVQSASSVASAPPSEDKSKTAATTTEQKAEKMTPDEPSAPEVTPPRFEYASVLPEMEVVIPPEELRPQTTTAKAEPVTTPPAPEQAIGVVYDLQLGSYTKQADAERVKASLALLGITTRIQKVTVDDRGTYYRVRSGPYSRDQAYSLHGQLTKNGVENQIYRLKQ